LNGGGSLAGKRSSVLIERSVDDVVTVREDEIAGRA
jgi:hypothetical protein